MLSKLFAIILMAFMKCNDLSKDTFKNMQGLKCSFTKYRSDFGGFPDAHKLRQRTYISHHACKKWCNEMKGCKAAVLSPSHWVHRECFLVSTSKITSRDKWKAAIKKCEKATEAPERTQRPPEQEFVFQLINENGNPVGANVEALLTYQGGTVCDDHFTDNSATAICKEMGFSHSEMWTSGSVRHDLQSSLEISLDDVNCSDEDWSSCDFAETSHNCAHSKDVFLKCAVVPNNTQGTHQLANCDIQIRGKFVKCSAENESSHYRCLLSNQTYDPIQLTVLGSWSVESLCDKDPHFYQACGLDPKGASKFLFNQWTQESGKYPCGFLCQQGPSYIYPVTTLHATHKMCRMKGCLNTDLEEKFCDSGDSKDCDNVCHVPRSCLDESQCGGYQYGAFCGGIGTTSDPINLIHPRYTCDGTPHCSNGLDEKNCTVDEGSPSCPLESGRLVPLYNYTRCASLFYQPLSFRDSDKPSFMKVCRNFMDQTNCSDPTRVGVFCPINGFMSSVARQIICLSESEFPDNKIPEVKKLCDDGLDKACVVVSRFCYVHKHLMCDGERDCADGSDETHKHCEVMTKRVYRRRFNKGTANVGFPLKWVEDGLADSWEGEDESKEWPKCGNGTTTRFVEHGSRCQEVFLCYDSNTPFVELSQLCDMRDSCSNENTLCAESRGRVQPNAVVLKYQHVSVVSYCLKGLSSLEVLHETLCELRAFRTTTNVIGMNMTTNIRLPIKHHDCRGFYGEYYVYLSCLGLCRNSKCLLHRRIRWDSCPAQFDINKLFTMSSDGQITFLVYDRRTSELGTRFFVCENNKCVGYERVCNLVDDCGDGSDEADCTNHFLCSSKSKYYIPLVQKCDGVFHCPDMSDECNESCRIKLISQSYLKSLACMIGLPAIIFNCISLTNSLNNLYSKSRSEPALLTHGLVTIICTGDLLMGSYLATISFLDFYFGFSYCFRHFEWITSSACEVLGIISTLASYLSLFSMTSLGIHRALGVNQDFAIPREVKRSSYLKLLLMSIAIVLASLLVALLPLIKNLEEFFNNGARLETFNPLFQGSLKKKKFLAILSKYYGRITLRQENIPWLQVEGLVASMFSKDYSGVKFMRQTFYGSDAVCLFKYFVNQDDPQSIFVVAILGLNLICFTSIALSYGRLLKKVTRTTKAISKHVKENKKLKYLIQLRRTTFTVIFTDFLCWVPFVVICSLHYIGVLDAASLYPFFTIVILPINSVINPLIYDKTLNNKFTAVFGLCRVSLVKILNFLARLNDLMGYILADETPQAQEGIELHEIAQRELQ